MCAVVATFSQLEPLVRLAAVPFPPQDAAPMMAPMSAAPPMMAMGGAVPFGIAPGAGFYPPVMPQMVQQQAVTQPQVHNSNTSQCTPTAHS